VVYNTDQFLILYENLMDNKMVYCNQNVEVAVDYVRHALNNLHSIIYNLDINQIVTKKFHESLREFHVLMYQYVDRIIKKCNSKFNSKQLNTNSSYYDQYGPKPFNYFSDDVHGDPQFEFY